MKLKIEPELRKEISNAVRRALSEDRASEDLTSRLLFGKSYRAEGEIVAKQAGVLCGVEIAAQVLKTLDPRAQVKILMKDGARVSPGRRVLTLRGDLSRVLAAERTALNFIQHLSGIATLTHRFVERVKGTGVRIFDTRKTVPGLRRLEKYAVRAGGGANHRMDLHGAAMVKDNHLRAMLCRSSKAEAQLRVVELRKKLPKGTSLVMEAAAFEEVDLALLSGADVILLDNMAIPQIKEAVRWIRKFQDEIQPEIEVSGGVTLENVRQIARCGVDRISVGRLTHSAPALDLSLEVR